MCCISHTNSSKHQSGAAATEEKTMIARIASLGMGYVFGSFLTAEVVARKLAHKSAFELGVGNPGMANIGHELGAKAAATVLAGDILKTLAAWLVARAAFPAEADVAGIWAGLGATLGHNYPAWHSFKGGKGVTTTCSAIILANPILGGISSLVGVASVIFGGYLCVGAVSITGSYLMLILLFDRSVDRIFSASVLTILMLFAHHAAIAGIKSGATPRAHISKKFTR
jgi:glycerol-3-phosphate acyltransferase PlsY